jgi:hypothetical protein
MLLWTLFLYVSCLSGPPAYRWCKASAAVWGHHVVAPRPGPRASSRPGRAHRELRRAISERDVVSMWLEVG